MNLRATTISQNLNSSVPNSKGNSNIPPKRNADNSIDIKSIQVIRLLKID